MNDTVSRRKSTFSFKSLPYNKRLMPYIFVSPFIISFLIFFLYPTIDSFVMSFQQMKGFTSSIFVGFENFSRLFNYHFKNAVITNSVYSLLTILVLIPVPLIFAVILNSKLMKCRTAFRASIFIPSLISALIAGIVFRLMFSDLKTGLFNRIVVALGGKPVAWNMGYWTGMLMMVVLNAWKTIGINMMYYLSAMQSIPLEIYESSEMDGANAFHKFRYITVPLLKPIIAYILTLTIISGYRMFTESYVYWVDTTPGDIGLTIVRYIYSMSFQRNDMGFGAAIGIVLLLIIMLINVFQLRRFGMFGKVKD